MNPPFFAHCFVLCARGRLWRRSRRTRRRSPIAQGAREIAVTAEGLSFDPDEIHVDVGEDIAIVLTSEDGQHDFTVDDLDAHVAVGPADTARGGLKADEPGRYEFYCSVPGHRDGGMEGVLVVE